jgi:hypothetical protein
MRISGKYDCLPFKNTKTASPPQRRAAAKLRIRLKVIEYYFPGYRVKGAGGRIYTPQ